MINIEKVNDILSYFAENVPNLTVTKVMKLFYYVDFIAFAENDASVTNDVYYKLPYGPIPSFVKNEINALTFKSVLKKIDVEQSQTQLSEQFLVKKDKIGVYDAIIIENTEKEIKIESLSEYEINLVGRVVDKFKNFSAKELVDQTHSEKPYLLTSENEIIDYNLAKFLDLSAI